MSDIRREQERLFDGFESMEEKAERQILRNYQGRLIDLKKVLGDLFERYEDDGQLTYDELTRYGRLHKAQESFKGIVVNLYTDNTKEITSAIKTAYINGFNGTGQAVGKALGGKSLIGIIRVDEIKRALTNDISGLKWTERMEINRDFAAQKIRETIVQGLHNGETYAQMAQRLNDTMGKDVPGAVRIVRTECYRVFSEARKDRLDRVQGVNMTKEWITAKDECVRSNHASMHGVKVPYNQDFILPNGNSGFGPGMIGAAADDINCRCFWVIDVAEDDSDNHYIPGNDEDLENDLHEQGNNSIMDSGRETMNLLPRYDEAVIPTEKFTRYVLDYTADYDKATAFYRALGYKVDNADMLINNIRNNLPNYEAKEKGDLGHGMRYEVIMSLKGENRKTANVLTAWIDDKNNGEMRLINAYVDKKKGGRRDD